MSLSFKKRNDLSTPGYVYKLKYSCNLTSEKEEKEDGANVNALNENLHITTPAR